MFSAPVSHKRQAPWHDRAFRRPVRDCYACYDTGVVVNGDGLLNVLLPDFDLLADGRRLPGVDVPLVCCCHAAHRGGGGGLRGADGLVGQRRAAVLPADQVAWLHERRLASWLESERLMQEAWQQRAAGQTKAAPWFVAELRESLEQQRRHGTEVLEATGGVGLQAIGSVLGATVARNLAVAAAADAASLEAPSAQPDTAT